MTCTTTRTKKGIKKRKPVRRCTTKTLAGSAVFTAATANASLSRGGKIVATGTARRSSGLVLRSARALAGGRYTLTLRYRQGTRRIVVTAPFTMR